MKCFKTAISLKIAMAMALLSFASAALMAEEGVKCGDILMAYNKLFTTINARMMAVTGEFKALPAGGDPEPVRKKYCVIGGEMLGQYKGVQLQVAACLKKGESLGEVPKIINEQVDGIQAVIHENCG